MAITDISKDLSKRGASTDIIDILNATTDAARRRPDKRPIKVPIEEIDLSKRVTVSKKLSAFLAYDNNKTDITPRIIPITIGKEKFTLNIIVSRKAINITSVLEKAIPAAKLL